MTVFFYMFIFLFYKFVTWCFSLFLEDSYPPSLQDCFCPIFFPSWDSNNILFSSRIFIQFLFVVSRAIVKFYVLLTIFFIVLITFLKQWLISSFMIIPECVSIDYFSLLLYLFCCCCNKWSYLIFWVLCQVLEVIVYLIFLSESIYSNLPQRARMEKMITNSRLSTRQVGLHFWKVQFVSC